MSNPSFLSGNTGNQNRRLIANRMRRILITFVGDDACETAAKAIQGLSESTAADIKIRIAIDGNARGIERLKTQVNQSPCMIDVLNNGDHLEPHILWADIAMTSAGDTCWEMARLGLPMILVATCDKAKAIEEFVAEDAVVHLGIHDDLQSQDFLNVFHELLYSFPRRCKMAENARKIIDRRQLQALPATEIPDTRAA